MPFLYRSTTKKRVLKLFLLVLFCTATVFIHVYLVEKLAHSRPRSLKRCLRLLANDHKTRLQQNILFLKTHKTGSSTLTNILNRYADNRQLDVVVPASSEAYTFYWPLKFRLDFAHARFNNLSKVLCNHARFNKIAMNILMPKRKTKYITILREPLTHYESVFYFFHLGYILRPSEDSSPSTIDRFLTRSISLDKLGKWTKGRELSRLAKNPQLFDLGLDLEYYENKTAIEKYIDFLDSEFDLVLILEHLDESLVLMKRLFCWDLKDILYVKQMGRLKVDKGKETITDDLKRKIRRWNKADVMLYSHFNATLWKRIYSEGSEFEEDLRIFREELKRLQDVCLEKGAKKTHAYGGRYVSGYRVKANLTGTMRNYCQKFLLNEVDYLDYHRRGEKLD